ncbi:MAG: Type 1 glutamine amidotransferase-like domain-containing protein [Acidobacteriota bacterium]
MQLARRPGAGWIVLIGGGEFSFGATEAIDRAWLDKTADGAIGFVPAASGSTEYGGHLATYLQESFGRTAETIPIYRPRDARRGKNSARIAAASTVYLGGGVTDRLLEAFRDTPALDALTAKLEAGGVVVAIAAAAQSLGVVARSLFGGGSIAGFDWLEGGVVETNFDPSHDRRLRRLLEHPQARWGLGLPAGSAVLLGPDDEVETIGKVFVLPDSEGDLTVC